MVNPNPDYYKRVQLSPSKTVFSFDTLKDYNRFVDETTNVATGNAKTGLDIINAPNYISETAIDVKWYGTTDVSLVQNIDSYLFNNELDNFLGSFTRDTVNVDTIDIDQQKTLKMTEMPIGIFSFDLASLGLIPVYEFYSPVLKKIVSGNLVVSEKVNGVVVFYHVYIPAIEEHTVHYDIGLGGYYSKVLKVLVKLEDLIEINDGSGIRFAYPRQNEVQKHRVDRIHKEDENGKKKWATTWKKVFVHIPKIEKSLPRIDIIVGANYNSNVSANTEMIYNSMAAIAIAEKLSRSGINYRIIVCYPVLSTGKGGEKEVYSYVVAKKDGDPFDKNKIAILLSDARQFRYQQFRGFLASQYDAGYDDNIDPDGIGRGISSSDRIKDAYIEYLGKSDSNEDREAAKLKDSKIIFSGIKTRQEAENAYTSTIRKISKINI